MTPIVREDEPHFGGNSVPLVTLGALVDIVREEHAPALPMELQLLDALRQGAKVLEQSVLLVAGLVKVPETAADEHPVGHGADHDKHSHHGKHSRREVAEVKRA